MKKPMNELYSVADEPWDQGLGHHRVVIQVDNDEDAVRVKIPWRRRDDCPKWKRIIIVHKETNSQVKNLFIFKFTKDLGDIVFQPKFGSGTYYLYYLPFQVQKNDGYYHKWYLLRKITANPIWIFKNKLLSKSHIEKLTVCQNYVFESRSEMDSFYPMELPATEKELNHFLNTHTDELLIFLEDRDHPVRMFDALPLRWIKNGPSDTFSATLKRNEYFVFQLGLYSRSQQISNVDIKFTDLMNEDNSASLESSSFTCFNKTGIDPEGTHFEKLITVPKKGIQSLWIGIDVPKALEPGLYHSTISIFTANAISRKIHINLTVSEEISEDRGDNSPKLHSRLQWLNSTRGLDQKVIPGFAPLKLKDNTIQYSLRELTLDQYGFPFQISSSENLLLSPMKLHVSGEYNFQMTKSLEITLLSENRVGWTSEFQATSCKIFVNGITESDGYCNYHVTILPLENMSLKNVEFHWKMDANFAEYFMGFGYPGSKFPYRKKLRWKKYYNNVWVGNHKVGMCMKFLGASYTGPLLKLYKPKPPNSWYNRNRGLIRLGKQDDNVNILEISTGSRILKKGTPLELKFDLLITPSKSLDSSGHFQNRYYHHPKPLDEHIKAGVKIINVHHANELNPYINYPFHTGEKIREFVESNHKRGLKVKLYYTIRELTNFTIEIWALRSLGNEIFADGKGKKYIIGKGYPWLREHLKTDYEHAWYAHLPNGTIDSAIVTSGGKSRLLNYYLKGLAWMLKNYDIDGLYLDDVSFGRNIMQRMRKIMEEIKPGECMIDLHSNTGFSKGPATKYMEFFPYVDKLWFGESFRYNQMSADNWFVEVSGIPFGLMGEMLQGGGNRWLGMIYGMSTRLPWNSDNDNADPRPVWKIWDYFEIHKAEMIGYWEDKCPVRTNRSDVKSTVFKKSDSMLIAIGNFSRKKQNIDLMIDWGVLNWKKEDVNIESPNFQGFQEELNMKIGDKLTIPPKRGRIVILRKKIK